MQPSPIWRKKYQEWKCKRVFIIIQILMSVVEIIIVMLSSYLPCAFYGNASMHIFWIHQYVTMSVNIFCPPIQQMMFIKYIFILAFVSLEFCKTVLHPRNSLLTGTFLFLDIILFLFEKKIFLKFPMTWKFHRSFLMEIPAQSSLACLWTNNRLKLIHLFILYHLRFSHVHYSFS